MGNPSPKQILIEAIIFWTIAACLFVGRVWSRAILKSSWKKFQIDDYTMIVTFGFYTTLLVLLQFSSRYATNEMDPEELTAILADPQEVADRIFGSKIAVASNQCYLLTLWGVKTCLLSLYYQITRGLPRHSMFVKIVIGYVAFGLLAIEIPDFFILCRPFSQYWALPVKNKQCATYFYYCIIQMVFNITTDLLMLAIPIPFIISVRVTRVRKAMLGGIFSLGIFVILAAVLSKYYNFSMPNTTVYMVWDIRETGTAMCVANIMCLWPLLRKVFGWSTFARSSGRSKSSQRQTSQPLPSMPTPKTGAMPMVDCVGRDKHWDEESTCEFAPGTAW